MTTDLVQSKTCANRTCGLVFTRQPGQSEQSWVMTRFCPGCGVKRSRGKKRPSAPAVPVPADSELIPDFGSGVEREWLTFAVCRDEDPELFFAVGTSGPARLQNAEAKTVCRRCPVVTSCLTWALEVGEVGVWGGMDEEERRVLKRRNARTRARTA